MSDEENALEGLRQMLNEWAVRAEHDLDLDRIEEFRRALLLEMEHDDERHREWAQQALRRLEEHQPPN